MSTGIFGLLIGCVGGATIVAMLFDLIVWPTGSRYRAAVRRFHSIQAALDEKEGV